MNKKYYHEEDYPLLSIYLNQLIENNPYALSMYNNHDDSVILYLIKVTDDEVKNQYELILIKELLEAKLNRIYISRLIDKLDLRQINDREIINIAVKAVLDNNKKLVDNIKSGNTKAINSLFGIIFKTNKNFNPDIINSILYELLEID